MFLYNNAIYCCLGSLYPPSRDVARKPRYVMIYLYTRTIRLSALFIRKSDFGGHTK
jgi:hypothetical protein